ncbi:unnamed protein product, partial [Prorocentrum cordatum]
MRGCLARPRAAWPGCSRTCSSASRGLSDCGARQRRRRSGRGSSRWTRIATIASRLGLPGLCGADELLVVYRVLYARWRMPWQTPVTKAEASKAREEKQKWMAEDALLFHDDNRDGGICYEEFEQTILKFDAVRQRAKDIKDLQRKPQELFKREKYWIRQHMCTDSDCETLKQLDKDYAPIEQRLA